MKKFKTGDFVKLTEFQQMIVRNYNKDGSVKCNWFSANGILFEDNFPEDQPILISRENFDERPIFIVGQDVVLKFTGIEMKIKTVDYKNDPSLVLCEWNDPQSGKAVEKDFFIQQLQDNSPIPIDNIFRGF